MNHPTDDAGGARGGGRQPEAIAEIDILWITAGLGCDGDTIAITAATQPSVEDLVLGSLPWIPKVNCAIRFSPTKTAKVPRHFRQAAEGSLQPFMLVVEGSIPDETNKTEGYWAAFGMIRQPGSR